MSNSMYARRSILSALPSFAALAAALALLWPARALAADTDLDGTDDAFDNCIFLANPGQPNTDGDIYGNACDNCMLVANSNQLNSDLDQFGDACDNCPTVTNI